MTSEQRLRMAKDLLESYTKHVDERAILDRIYIEMRKAKLDFDDQTKSILSYIVDGLMYGNWPWFRINKVYK